MKYNKRNIGERIRECRKAYRNDKNYADHAPDQAGFGALLVEDSEKEVHTNTISSWENGKTLPELKYLLKMCDLFDCELGYLLCEYDTKTRAATDIQEETGLSEKAINVLRTETRFLAEIAGTSESTQFPTLNNKLNLIDAFITGCDPIFQSFNELLYDQFLWAASHNQLEHQTIDLSESLNLFNEIYDSPIPEYEKISRFVNDGYKKYGYTKQDEQNHQLAFNENLEKQVKDFLYYEYQMFVNERTHNKTNNYRFNMTLVFNQIIDSLLNTFGDDNERK